MFFLIKKLFSFFYIDRVTENIIEGLIYAIHNLTVWKDIELLANGSLLICLKGRKEGLKDTHLKGPREFYYL